MNSDTTPTVMGSMNLERHLTSIEYPGLVIDHEKAITSLGGITTLSSTHSQGNRKIELRFRPDDPFCKPAHGERIQTSNLLFKVIRKTRRNKKTNETQTSYHVDVEGVIGTTYRFSTLCDFQYLPMEKNSDFTDGQSQDRFVSIVEKVVPQGLVSLDWLNEPCPIFMSPPLFSRMDVPVEYNFRNESGMAAANNKNVNVIGRLRKRRSLQAIFLNFEDEYVPDKPRELAVRNLAVRFIKQDDVDAVKKLFEERPVWTKAALAYSAGQVEPTSLKYILTASAYYFTTGPWRNAWIRIGYDPRKDPSARIYQILDYRILQTLKSKVTPKRSYTSYTQPHKYGSAQRNKTSSIRQQQETASAELSIRTEESFAFRPGFIPKCRQMFYQLCDLHVPEIKTLLEVTPPNDTCNERHGWFPPHVEEECRRILSECILKAFGQQRGKKKSTKKSKAEDETDEDDEDEDDEEEEYADDEEADAATGQEETNLNESLDESSCSDDEAD